MQAQLTQINDKLVDHDQRFEAIENHARIFEFRVDDRFDTVEQSLAEIKATTDRVMNLLDGIAGRLDIDETEGVALGSQVTRHEDWIEETAPVVGVKYAPGA